MLVPQLAFTEADIDMCGGGYVRPLAEHCRYVAQTGRASLNPRSGSREPYMLRPVAHAAHNIKGDTALLAHGILYPSLPRLLQMIFQMEHRDAR
jgi:hypothetical protein